MKENFFLFKKTGWLVLLRKMRDIYIAHHMKYEGD